MKNEAAKKILTAILALAGIGVMWYYTRCTDSCAYLTGDVLGIDLKYLGIGYMALVIVFALAGRDSMLRFLLAGGIGGEVFLFGFQVSKGVFCPYCLAFAVTLILAFIINYRRPTAGKTGWRRWAYLLGDVPVPLKGRTEILPLSVISLAGFAFFVLAFTGSVTPVYAADQNGPAVYGSGPIELRLYSDYFCFPCQTLEGSSEELLNQIVARKRARVVLIDVPIHKETREIYARYFLYATCSNPGYEAAMKARIALFAAAKENIRTETELMNFLRTKGIKLSLCPTKDYFQGLSKYIKEDGVDSTPTMVIVSQKGKKKYDSREAIEKTLRELAE